MCNCNENILGRKIVSHTKDSDNLIGMNVLTTSAKSGKVIENIYNSTEIIGYVISNIEGNKFRILKGEILLKNN